MNLTDSSWRSIAQGIRKCPYITYRDVGFRTSNTRAFGSLLQKRAAPPLAHSVHAAGESTALNNGGCYLVDKKRLQAGRTSLCGTLLLGPIRGGLVTGLHKSLCQLITRGELSSTTI